MFSLCRYRGQKTRFTASILDFIDVGISTRFWDVCAGSGCVAIAAAARGVPACQITLVEKGPWGIFWCAVSTGTFDQDRFKFWLDKLPENQTDVTSYLKNLYTKTVELSDAPYVFLILQSASVHGSAFGFTRASPTTIQWTGSYSVAKYFLPTKTSIRRYPTRVLPLSTELLKRTELVVGLLSGATVIHDDVKNVSLPARGSTVYVDPPYPNTTGYSSPTSVEYPKIKKWAKECASSGLDVFMSAYVVWEDGISRWKHVGNCRKGGAGRTKPTKTEFIMKLN